MERAGELGREHHRAQNTHDVAVGILSFAKNASVPKTVIFYWFWRLGSGIQRLNLWHVTWTALNFPKEEFMEWWREDEGA
jgi:hypothetical protein